MGGFEMNFWEKIQKDLKKELKAGIAFLKESSAVAKKKVNELSEEGKKKLHLLELKSKVKEGMAELGGMVYSLHSINKDPMINKKVKGIISKIKKIETQIKKLENKVEAPIKKAKTKKSTKTKNT